MNRERILAVLYDLAMVIGGEVRLRPLLTKTLQRLLYHTSFPAGAVFLDVPPSAGASVAAPLELAIGDFELARHENETLVLPTEFIRGGMALLEDRALIDSLPGRKGGYAAALRLPIDDRGVAILLSPATPQSDLPLTQVFQPVMANLAKAILLCRRNEAFTSTLISDRDRARSTLERFRAALDASSDSVFLIDPQQMRFIDFNNSAETSSGYARAELLERGLQDLVRTDGQERLAQSHAALARGESPIVDLDAVLCRKDGTEYPAAIRLNLFSHAPDAKLVIAIARDITERKSLETKLRQLNENLERRVEEEVTQNREKDHILIQQSRLASMGEMVHNIAHQWRQPLNALSIIVTNIKDDFEFHQLTAESLDRDVRKARALLQGMSSTIDDFRDFFRPDREPGDFDLAKAVEEAMFVMSASLKNNHIEVRRDLPPGLKVNGFSNQFAQVVLNVLANAKEAIQQKCSDGGWISVGLARCGEMAALTVGDNGGGIPEAILPKIFDPYFSTKEQGSGIGLYMSKMIVERNFKGNIMAANADQGALITIVLPLAEEVA